MALEVVGVPVLSRHQRPLAVLWVVKPRYAMHLSALPASGLGVGEKAEGHGEGFAPRHLLVLQLCGALLSAAFQRLISSGAEEGRAGDGTGLREERSGWATPQRHTATQGLWNGSPGHPSRGSMSEDEGRSREAGGRGRSGVGLQGGAVGWRYREEWEVMDRVHGVMDAALRLSSSNQALRDDLTRRQQGGEVGRQRRARGQQGGEGPGVMFKDTAQGAGKHRGKEAMGREAWAGDGRRADTGARKVAGREGVKGDKY